MDLFEYQARAMFASYGVPVPGGTLATTPDQAEQAAQHLLDGGCDLLVVKAQVKTGGRGKAGGVRLARSAEEARSHAEAILGMDIKGHTVEAVLVSQGVDVAEEYYVAVLLDRTQGQYLVLCSREGGVEIEAQAREHPDSLVRLPVDPLTGLTPEAAGQLVAAAGLPQGGTATQAALVVKRLWKVFTAEDATLVEVNPLVLTSGGEVLALDGKVTLDDNAGFRHPGHADLAEAHSHDPLEARAQDAGLNYVRLDGQVGVLGNGAGLVMATLDVVAAAGERRGGIRPANFLDLGGGSSAQVMATGLEIVASDPQVRAILVNVFGGITSCDTVAEGMVAAVEHLGGLPKPVVVRLDGNNAPRALQMLEEAGIEGVTVAETMEVAADVVTAIAGQAAPTGGGAAGAGEADGAAAPPAEQPAAGRRTVPLQQAEAEES